MLDIARIRADTDGVDEIIHLNNAGSSLPPRAVVGAQIDYLRAEQRRGGYETADERRDEIDDFYTATAELLGCGANEVAFTSGASDSWWRAFAAVELRPGDRVVTGASEFQSGAFGLLQARDRGIEVVVVPNAPSGVVDLDQLDRALEQGVAMACFTQISMSNGAVHPVAEIGARCREREVIFLLDACQAAGQMPLDVGELGCDFLCYTGRKFMRGPRGTGVLYARSGVLDRLGPQPFVDGRSAEWHDDESWSLHAGAMRFELGEQAFAAKVGLGVATRYALGIGLDPIAQRIHLLAERLRIALSEVPGVAVRDEGARRSGIVTFTVAGHEPAAVAANLRSQRIHVSAPGRRNAQWDLGRRGIDAVVRAGVHYFNTDDELDRLVAAVGAIRAI